MLTMPTISLFSALGVKRFLHKLGLGAFRNGIVNSPFVTIANRQFSLGSVSLRRSRNVRRELIKKLNDFGAGRPVEGARVPSPQALSRTPWDLLQFLDTCCDPEQLSLGSLKYLNEALFDSLKINKCSIAETKRVLSSAGMQKLSQAVEKHCFNLSSKDLIDVCKLFVYLDTPGSHPTFQMVLRLLWKHTNSNSLSPFEILFLNFLMNQLKKESKSPISEAITRALPKLFESQLNNKLEDVNLWELIDCLQYAVKNRCSEGVLKKILKLILKKQSQLNYKQAHSAVWSLAECPHDLKPESAELLKTSFNILAVNIHLLNTKQLGVLSYCAKASTAVIDHFYTEDFIETPVHRLIVEAQQDQDMAVALDFSNQISTTCSTIPDRKNAPLCRHCGAKKETIHHVLSECGKGNQLRITRHHEILSIIAKALREAPSFGQGFWIVEEEVECHDENGSPRTVDIFCYNQEQKAGFIIDPTVRFEQCTEEQAIKVDREKKARYEPCAKYFKDHYGLDQVEVVGLLVGATGTMTSFFEKFRTRFGLSLTITDDIAAVAIRRSNLIVHRHLYTRRRISSSRTEICKKLTLPSLTEILKS